MVENCGRKTVCTTDVVFALHRMGRTLYVNLSVQQVKANTDMQ